MLRGDVENIDEAIASFRNAINGGTFDARIKWTLKSLTISKVNAQAISGVIRFETGLMDHVPLFNTCTTAFYTTAF